MNHYKLDLHTHSIHSMDGGIAADDYKKILQEGKLDFIAVTDHDAIDFAVWLQKKLGENIIVGEEIRTAEGEVIGLFLTEKIPPKLSLEETVARIAEQHGLMYLPHPFCHNRFGVSEESIEPFLKQIQIIEHFNPRNIVHSDNTRAEAFAAAQKIPMAASSDAHCPQELGRTYTILTKTPKKNDLVHQLKEATFVQNYTSFYHLLCPKKNVLKKRLGLR